MPAPIRVFLAAVAVGALVPVQGSAQGSPYIPLDDPRLPLLEHLIARGDIEDPSPMIRPFRRADAARVLAAADSAGASRFVRALREQFEDPPDQNSWRFGIRAGAQAFSHIRRDVLHPLGPDGVRPYADLTGEATFGPFALVSRPAAEPRIVDDPEWPGRHDLTLAWRMVEAYASAQFKYGSVFYGQMDRNWGPVGISWHRTEQLRVFRGGVGLRFGHPDAAAAHARPSAEGRGLTRQPGPSLLLCPPGGRSRLQQAQSRRVGNRRPRGRGPSVRRAVSQSPESAAPRRSVRTRARRERGGGARRLMATDSPPHARDPTGARRSAVRADIRAATLPQPLGAHRLGIRSAGASLGWRALYTQASSLAFRTIDPFENLTDAGVGIGRNFDDQDQTTLTVTVPRGTFWLFTPELTLLRQGEGRIDDPFPL